MYDALLIAIIMIMILIIIITLASPRRLGGVEAHSQDIGEAALTAWPRKIESK